MKPSDNIKEIREMLEQKEGRKLTDEEFSKKLFEFIRTMNEYDDEDEEVTEQTAQNVDDFLYLADTAPTEKKARYFVKKALALDPDNIEAKRQLVEIGAKSLDDILNGYKRIIFETEKQFEADGYFNLTGIGHFWEIWETRPFMRLLSGYAELLANTGKVKLAIKQCEYMLYLCENDNLGERHRLMHLYAYIEDVEAAEKLISKYETEKDTAMMALPLSVLYYKTGNMRKAKQYLKNLAKSNGDTRVFINEMASGELKDFLDDEEEIEMYRPGSYEEFLMAFQEYTFFYTSNLYYFIWASSQLKKMK